MVFICELPLHTLLRFWCETKNLGLHQLIIIKMDALEERLSKPIMDDKSAREVKEIKRENISFCMNMPICVCILCWCV